MKKICFKPENITFIWLLIFACKERMVYMTRRNKKHITLLQLVTLGINNVIDIISLYNKDYLIKTMNVRLNRRKHINFEVSLGTRSNFECVVMKVVHGYF